jgi:hypothetical protein
MLDFITSVDGNNTLRHIEIFAAFQACILHHLFKLILFWVHTNGFSQVAVTVFILGNKLANFGKQLK